MAARRVSLLLSVCLLLALSTCASIGPATVPRDREDYLEALGSSWKEQTLLNIVRLRYADAPTFLDVSSIVSSYSLQGQVSAGGQINSSRTATVPGASAIFGANATYLDRPTISYTPIAGDRFTKSLLTPIPPAAVFELIQAGYPADFVLQVTTRALNGVFNRSSVGGRARGADPKFYPILDALRRLQLSGAVGLRLERRGQDETLRLILAGERSAEVDADIRFVREALGVAPDARDEITVTFGAVPRTVNELAVLTRSMMEILIEVAQGIDVPPQDVADGRTPASVAPAQRPGPARPSHRPGIHWPFAALGRVRGDRASRRVVLDRRPRPRLQARLLGADAVLLARRDRRGATGAGADSACQLSPHRPQLRRISILLRRSSPPAGT